MRASRAAGDIAMIDACTKKAAAAAIRQAHCSAR
jgi:hypothetical protein